MKRLGWLWFVAIGAALVLGIVVAGRMGSTNPAMVRGRVVLAPEVAPAARGVRTLYLIVSPSERPMPFGAFRKSLGADPEGEVYEFALTLDNLQRMRMDEPWPESFKVKARLDRDGAAGPDQLGDLVGEVTGLTPGAKDVVVNIGRVIE